MGFVEDAVSDAVKREATKAIERETSSIESILAVVFGKVR